MTYLYKGVNLTQILHAGANVLSGYNTGSLGTTNIDFTTTNKANNKPLTIPYLYGNTAISNTYAAKHQLFDTPANTATAITKPVGANALRYIISGASGGGGGGSGGAWEGSGENHATRGFSGEVGQQGRILYSTSDISIANVNQISYWIGAGGAAGAGGAGVTGGNADNHSVSSVAGDAGGTGSYTNLNVGGVDYAVSGGIGGRGAAVQYANSTYGHGGSFSGADTATANSDGSVNGLYGTSSYGVTEQRPNEYGNVLTGTAPAATTDVINNTNWDNGIYSPIVLGGNGGDGGWGYSNSVNNGGANAGSPGIAGAKGRVTIIWLY